jgi:kynurenine 3-monooxygenase
MQMGDRFDYNQFYLKVGYKELEIPAGAMGEFKMEKNALHIWPRGAFMMIALPNPAGDFTCTLFVPFEGEKSFDAVKTQADVQQFFAQEFPDAVPLMPTLLEDYFKNPTASLVTVRCYPWVKGDKLALMGDAAHAVVPFYGQGMNCSFEDVVVMDECIEKYGNDWNKVFDEYQKLRKPNADAISQLAIQNYTEMAEKVGDKHFLHKKHIEHDLSDLYPDKFKSQYELTTFSLSPYKYALDQGEKNDRLLEKIIADGAEEKIKDPAYMDGLWHLIA